MNKITFLTSTQPERLRVNNHTTTMVTFVKELNNKIENKTLAGLILLLFIISFQIFWKIGWIGFWLIHGSEVHSTLVFTLVFTLVSKLVATLYPLSEVRWVFWDILALDLRSGCSLRCALLLQGGRHRFALERSEIQKRPSYFAAWLVYKHSFVHFLAVPLYFYSF